jgi:hypothetical protein
VPSAEGSCEHVSHPLGGDRVVDRWHKHRPHRKGGSRQQVAYTRHLGRGQPITDLSCFGVSQRRSMRAQHSNSRSHELRVGIVFILAYGYM